MSAVVCSQRLFMHSLKFNQLQVIRKIYETGSLSAAAHQLNLTISAVSRALRKCQQEFADDLFVRNYQGMAPTERCRTLIPIVDRLLNSFEELTNSRTFEPAQITRTLSIAAADNAVVMILRPVIQALGRQAPKMNFRLLPLSETVFRELAEGSVDFALFPTSLRETLPDHFHGLKLFDIYRVCLVRKEHPLALRFAQGKKLTKKEFLKYPKIAVELRQNAREPVFDVDTISTHDQRKLIELPHFLGAPYFLEDTDATLVLPHTTAEFFAQMLPSLTVIPIPGEKRVYSARLIWHERNHASSEMQWIRSVFVSTLRKSASMETNLPKPDACHKESP